MVPIEGYSQLPDLTQAYSTSYTLPSLKRSRDILGNLMFSSVITLLSLTVISLTYAILQNIGYDAKLTTLFFIQNLSLMGNFILLGIGLGIPLVMLASFLGWIQLLLLIRGNITPHLASQGFIKVLDTLSSKM